MQVTKKETYYIKHVASNGDMLLKRSNKHNNTDRVLKDEDMRITIIAIPAKMLSFSVLNRHAMIMSSFVSY